MWGSKFLRPETNLYWEFRRDSWLGVGWEFDRDRYGWRIGFRTGWLFWSARFLLVNRKHG